MSNSLKFPGLPLNSVERRTFRNFRRPHLREGKDSEPPIVNVGNGHQGDTSRLSVIRS